jgi:hypothetical protein
LLGMWGLLTADGTRGGQRETRGRETRRST